MKIKQIDMEEIKDNRVLKSKTLNLVKRDASQEEIDKLIELRAFDYFRTLENGGKVFRNGEDIINGLKNVYKSIKEVPDEYYDEFMDCYYEAKQSLEGNHISTFDVINGVFMVVSDVSVITFTNDDEQTYDSLSKSVSQYFIDKKNGCIEDVSSYDFLTAT